MLGLAWGSEPGACVAALGVHPLDTSPAQQIFALDSIVVALQSRGDFCPSLFIELDERCEGRLHLAYQRGGLVAGDLLFRHSFDAIGKPADGLSDMAMAAYARHELQTLLFEFTARYGPPVHTSEEAMRWENAHPVGAALFRSSGDDTIQVVLGHDGTGVAGSIRYLPPVPGDAGF